MPVIPNEVCDFGADLIPSPSPPEKGVTLSMAGEAKSFSGRRRI
jgi:hypothetical protein